MSTKKIVALLGLCILLNNSHAQVKKSTQILIVYLSRTNNTKAIAEIIQQNVGGKIVALEPEQPYPENYKATVEQVVKENQSGFLPPLKTRVEGMENYGIVFIGFPTWDMKMPPPVKSFLRQYNFKGKTIVPFNSNAGYGVGTGFQTVKDLCAGSTILEGFEIKAGAERNGQYLVIKDQKAKEAAAEVSKWLQKIKISKE